MLKKVEKIQMDKKALAGKRVAIVKSLFNGELTKNMEEACLKTLLEGGLLEKQIRVFEVPGALEIPIGCKIIGKNFDVMIALGVVVKGDTYHFELVSNECARGCMDVSLELGKPIIFEVISAYSMKDVLKRTGKDGNNKGREGAMAALAMLGFLSKKS